MRSFHLEFKKKTHYKCETCNLKGFTIEGFKRHISSIHGKEPENLKAFLKMDDGPTDISGGCKTPKLEQGIHFDLRNQFETTEKIEEIQQSRPSRLKKPKLEQDEVNSPIKSKSVFCENPSIPQTSTKASKLSNQVETVHEKAKFQCESCDLSYVSNSLLERHVEKIHLGKNLFRMIDPDQFWVDRK